MDGILPLAVWLAKPELRLPKPSRIGYKNRAANQRLYWGGVHCRGLAFVSRLPPAFAFNRLAKVFCFPNKSIEGGLDELWESFWRLCFYKSFNNCNTFAPNNRTFRPIIWMSWA
ncbi:MAG: hypothetical protein MUE85_06215 [Microscillaceae bacterium]|jgi:hypothetical protein|nr:hypothetical protein [Microscillaceae bacterium]